MICIDEKTGSRRNTASTPDGCPPRAARPAGSSSTSGNGTVSVIAALHVVTGQVVTEPVTRISAAFTGFLHRLTQCIARA